MVLVTLNAFQNKITVDVVDKQLSARDLAQLQCVFSRLSPGQCLLSAHQQL